MCKNTLVLIPICQCTQLICIFDGEVSSKPVILDKPYLNSEVERSLSCSGLNSRMILNLKIDDLQCINIFVHQAYSTPFMLNRNLYM